MHVRVFLFLSIFMLDKTSCRRKSLGILLHQQRVDFTFARSAMHGVGGGLGKNPVSGLTEGNNNFLLGAQNRRVVCVDVMSKP